MSSHVYSLLVTGRDVEKNFGNVCMKLLRSRYPFRSFQHPSPLYGLNPPLEGYVESRQSQNEQCRHPQKPSPHLNCTTRHAKQSLPRVSLQQKNPEIGVQQLLD